LSDYAYTSGPGESASRTLGAVVLLVAFAIMLYMECIPFLFAGSGPPPMQASPDMTPAERFPYFGFQFASLPAWVKVWMSFQDIIIGAALFFVLFYKPAQVYLACFIASHLFVFASVALMPTELLTLKMAAFSHWLWIPGLIVLLRAWPGIDKSTAYGAWATIAIAQLVFSLIFDIPDGFQFLMGLF
jgi:hypothetical protein